MANVIITTKAESTILKYSEEFADRLMAYFEPVGEKPKGYDNDNIPYWD